ncbi:hypothetical protein BJ322DRAFT_1103814 [Thelephora terrestris]|uniref:Uncharacterized protein n=1 Tax=Thelephora terrestris TaxID=56493 RepID=A0A9P6HS46_9AGAM|nr:hypothetical protein BJ322DRAFT_1103814 [Thelephora terrestris]
MTATPVDLRLSEGFVQDCFHSYLKSSLTQAKVERLVNAELLGSAEADLMITGPALCLYFAALRCTTNPPSVPLPRRSKASQAGMVTELSETNCPITFLSFLRVWVDSVPQIQGLIPEHQHDLARIICGLNPISSPNPALNGIAADLRAVAIEISQRRTFQDRYAEDLQAAIDAGRESDGLRVTAAFVPPPAYDLAPSHPPPVSPPYSPPSPSYQSLVSSPPQLPGRPRPSRDPKSPPRRRKHLEVPPPVPPKDPPRQLELTLSPPSPSLQPHSPVSSAPPSPSYLSDPSTPAIAIIRETLYAALADVIERSPSIRRMMKTDPPRAYFAAVGFAILDVATTAITPDGAIRGVMGQQLTLAMSPRELKPFLTELVSIGSAVKDCEAEDDADAIDMVSKGGMPLEPRMERTKKVLENGVGYDLRRQRGGEERNANRRSVRGRALTLANRINALALGTTRLKAFRERQNDVFSVLAGLGS